MTVQGKGLGKAGRRHGRAVEAAWQLEAYEEPMLLAACRNLDVAEEAWEMVRTQGLFSENRYHQKVPNPALAVARKAESQFAALMAQLDLRTPSQKPKRGRPGEFEARTRLLRESLAHNGSERWQ